jgi:hypothetical protein
VDSGGGDRHLPAAFHTFVVSSPLAANITNDMIEKLQNFGPMKILIQPSTDKHIGLALLDKLSERGQVLSK